MGKIRGTHSSPGIYTQFTDLSYAAKTLGVTTLGLVGETLQGPAFEPILISDYSQFQQYFGGCNAERFKDSLYPKYELPYIAKSYLSKSDRLYVCRVLGLSGYNAGPAFIITAESETDGKKYVVAVLRSRGSYTKYVNVGDECNPINKYDQLVFDCDKIELERYTNVSVVVKCDTLDINSEQEPHFDINALNSGQFTIVAKKYAPTDVDADAEGYVTIGRYPVSLNAGSKDYITSVLGSKATEGSAAVFVEELYDLRLKELIESSKVNVISSDVTKVNELVISAIADPVLDFVTIPANGLKRKNVGQTFLCNVPGEVVSGETINGFEYHELAEDGTVSGETKPMEVGYIYKVQSSTNKTTGETKYVYVPLLDENTHEKLRVGEIEYGLLYDQVKSVNVLAYDAFVARDEFEVSGETSGETGTTIVDRVVALTDMSDYHEQFRCGSTPWVVSELKGDAKDLQVKKLFRFHTITDGTGANTQVKISIANIRPDDGTFDVYVRDYYDSDGNPTILESYKNVTMVPGDSKYIALQIGTVDGAYEIKSKYIMVEVIENDMTKNCVPAGFLGYPVRDYEAYGLEAPSFTYNRFYDEDVKEKRQYFGLSDITGIDEDMLFYKGKNAYTEDYEHGYTHAFHLDSTLSDDIRKSLEEKNGITITVDGDPETTLITWDAVSPNNVTSEGIPPVIGSEQDMEGTIYEDVKLRKFTVCFYGGFDGWDIYRNSRTNTDEFKANKYKGTIINGHGQTFSKIQNGTGLALSGNCITSDYYAYLAGVNQFEIPEKYLINLLATPGIDYVNNTLLTNEVLDVVEEKRQDTFYVATTPDKPWGSSDAIDDMYSAQDVADNLDDTSIDTYYAATYYPWIKFFDEESNKYIFLPPTKDVLRNMADVDNKSYPWYAPAGTERGTVDCTKMHFFAKLEDEDTVYDGRINPLKTFSKEGVIVWGNKTMYTGDTPMDRVNVVRLMLYMKKLSVEACRRLIFEPNDTTLVDEFKDIVNPILAQIKSDRGITDYKLDPSQTPEQMDAHEMSATIWVKPTPTLEYIELNFVVTPQGVSFSEI